MKVQYHKTTVLDTDQNENDHTRDIPKGHDVQTQANAFQHTKFAHKNNIAQGQEYDGQATNLVVRVKNENGPEQRRRGAAPKSGIGQYEKTGLHAQNQCAMS